LSEGLLIARTCSDSGRDACSASSVAAAGAEALAHLAAPAAPEAAHCARKSAADEVVALEHV
jgi:hypothetical protein